MSAATTMAMRWAAASSPTWRRRRRLVQFASDVAELADRRRDIDLRDLVDDLHADLMTLRADDDD
jgi:hypothetical protein